MSIPVKISFNSKETSSFLKDNKELLAEAGNSDAESFKTLNIELPDYSKVKFGTTASVKSGSAQKASYKSAGSFTRHLQDKAFA